MSVVAGYHPIEEALRRGGAERLLVARRSRRIEALAEVARGRGVPVDAVTMEDLDRYCPRESHRGVLLLAGERESRSPRELTEVLSDCGPDALVVLLDGVTDPHNLGAVIRSADLFGAVAVVTTRRRAAPQTQVVQQTSAGAAEWVPLIRVTNLIRAIEELKRQEFWVYGADARGTDASLVSLTGRVALVLGAEGPGIHDLVRRSCDGLVRIPTSGHLDSLNVSVAAGVLMYEVRRQQTAATP